MLNDHCTIQMRSFQKRDNFKKVNLKSTSEMAHVPMKIKYTTTPKSLFTNKTIAVMFRLEGRNTCFVQATRGLDLKIFAIFILKNVVENSKPAPIQSNRIFFK